jgi:hypothetical protein
MTLPALIGGVGQQEGTWYAVLSGRKRVPGSVTVEPGSSVNVHGVRYSLLVHSYSNLRMRARLTQNSYQPGARLNVRAVLTEYGLPVDHRALVRVELVRPDMTTAILALNEVQPGVFETSVQASLPGVYQFRILAAGATLRGRPFTREQGLSGYVWRGGDAPPPTSKGDPGRRDDAICHLLECLLKNESLRKYFREHGLDLESLGKCVHQFCRELAVPGK